MSYPPPHQPGTITHKRGANHGLHVFLSIITCGLWAITGWPIAAMMGRKSKTKYTPPPTPPQHYGPPRQ